MVIAIIAILASLLLPALGRARERAIVVKCVSALRQVGIGLSSYTVDADGWLPGSKQATHQNILTGGDGQPTRLRLLVTGEYLKATPVAVRGIRISAGSMNNPLLYCPGLTYKSWPWQTEPPSAFWLDNRSGYCYLVPNSTGESGRGHVWRAPLGANMQISGTRILGDGTHEAMAGAAGKLNALVACFDAGAQTGAVNNASGDRPHGMQGASVLHFDASARFFARPWDTGLPGNYNDGDLFWTQAQAVY